MVDMSAAWLAVVLAALLYAAAGLVLLRRTLRWVRRRCGVAAGRLADPEPGDVAARRRRAARRWLGHALLAAAACGPLCLLWALRVEPFRPEVERLRLETPKLPPGAEPIRLVLLADTHCDAVARAEPRIPELVRGLAPHAIVFAGDAVNSREGLPHFRALARELAGIAPTWAVRGNWEAWWFREVDFYSGTGVTDLEEQAVPVRSGGAEIWLCGSAPRTAGGLPAGLRRVPPGRFTVFVHHYPEVGAEILRAGRADLALGADTHGGQVRLPLIGPLVRISRRGEYFDIGARRVGAGTLYVNRGIGMEGGTAPRVRFRCPPEITLIEVAPADQPPGHQDTKKD